MVKPLGSLSTLGVERSLTYTGEEKGGLDPYEGDSHLPLHYYRLSYELITLNTTTTNYYHEIFAAIERIYWIDGER